MERRLNLQDSRNIIQKGSLFILVIFYVLFINTMLYASEICSRAAVVVDASTGNILFEKNANLKLPPASTSKLMTAIVVIDNVKLSKVVRISKRATRVSPSKAGFKKGDMVTIEKLLYAALLRSANDAAVALAEAVAGSVNKFVEMMNKKAKEIGVKNTRFRNPHGLPARGQYTTASDLSKIMLYALKYPKIREIIGTRVTEVSTLNGRAIFLKNTNKLLWSDDNLIGGKTGYTRRARHCLVCAAERGDDTVIVAVLGCPSRKNLWKESELLIEKGFEAISNGIEHIVNLTNEKYKTIKISRKENEESLKFNNNSLNKNKRKKVIEKKTVKNNKPKITKRIRNYRGNKG